MSGSSPPASSEAAPTTPPIAVPVSTALLCTGLGGALGALARWTLVTAFPTASGTFPWTTLLVNVTGSALLALLPAWPVVWRRPWIPLFAGTGLLGGYTTMSAASVETATLLRHGSLLLGTAYCLVTVLAAVAAVAVVDGFVAAPARQRFADEEGDE